MDRRLVRNLMIQISEEWGNAIRNGEADKAKEIIREAIKRNGNAMEDKEFAWLMDNCLSHSDILADPNACETLSCSLCGKDKDSVRIILASGYGAICQSCVVVCFEIFERDGIPFKS